MKRIKNKVPLAFEYLNSVKVGKQQELAKRVLLDKITESDLTQDFI